MNEALGIITVVLAVGIYIPYLWQTIRGKIKPHPFSWALWTLLTAIIFVAQWSEGAGPGSWTTITVGIICFSITVSSLRYGCKNIKKIDVLLFLLGLLTIPLWFYTNSPMLSVIIVTMIDLIGYVPTYRKSFNDPKSEPVYFYLINVVRNVLAVCAIENVILETVLFPATMVFADLLLALFLIWRRNFFK